MKSLKSILKVILFISCTFFLGTGNSQTPPVKSPWSFMPEKKSRAKVLLVGTFHFGYPGLDAHVTKDEDKVDILSPHKQAEVEELADYIARFKPTKIAVEAGQNTRHLLNRKKRHETGKEPAKRNEIDQIAFRLMDRFNLDTIYGTDAGSMTDDYSKLHGVKTYMDSVYADYDWKSDSPLDSAYHEFYNYIDKVTVELPLLDVFKYMNSSDFIQLMHGAYLIGDFELQNYHGADFLAMYWYNRNLRIFRNIQMINPSSDDRILVLYGAGHIPILKHLFECSPEFELIDFGQL